jgi:hypothetical protein
MPMPYWTQSAWFIDPIGGNDMADGATAATALSTLAELSRRIGDGRLMQSTTVTLLSDVPNADVFAFWGEIGGVQSRLTIVGTPTLLAGPVAITSVVNQVVGTARQKVVVTGFDWTPYVGKRCRVVTSSAGTPIGTRFWVEKVGATTDEAFTSRPHFGGTPGVRNLVAGDEFVVEELTNAGVWAVDYLCSWSNTTSFSVALFASDLRFSAKRLQVSARGAATYARNLEAEFMTRFSGCDLSELGLLVCDSVSAVACKIAGHIQATRTAVLNVCSISGPLRSEFGYLQLKDQCSLLSRVQVGGLGEGWGRLYTLNLACWDWPSGEALAVYNSSFAELDGATWGSSAAAGTFFASVFSYAALIYSALPTVAGALSPGQDLNVGGTPRAFAGGPYIEATNNAGFVQRSP